MHLLRLNLPVRMHPKFCWLQVANPLNYTGHGGPPHILRP